MKIMEDFKLYIAVLDEFPDYMTPTLVAHGVLKAHLTFENEPQYQRWLHMSFKKVVVRVNQKEFDKISSLSGVCLACEYTTLGGKTSCAVVFPMHPDDVPNVLKFAKLWKPKDVKV